MSLIIECLVAGVSASIVFAIMYAVLKSCRPQTRQQAMILVPTLALLPVITHYSDFLPYDGPIRFLVVALLGGFVGVLVGAVIWLLGYRGRTAMSK